MSSSVALGSFFPVSLPSALVVAVDSSEPQDTSVSAVRRQELLAKFGHAMLTVLLLLENSDCQ